MIKGDLTMGWDKELVEYIDFTFEQLDDLKKEKGKVIKIPVDLYAACMSIIEPSKRFDSEEEFMEIKKNELIDMVTRAHLMIHGIF